MVPKHFIYYSKQNKENASIAPKQSGYPIEDVIKINFNFIALCRCSKLNVFSTRAIIILFIFSISWNHLQSISIILSVNQKKIKKYFERVPRKSFQKFSVMNYQTTAIRRTHTKTHRDKRIIKLKSLHHELNPFFFFFSKIYFYLLTINADKSKAISDEYDQMRLDTDSSNKIAGKEINSNELNADQNVNEFNQKSFSENFMDLLQNEIENDENVAYKSALLLKLLEVINRLSHNLCYFLLAPK